MDIQRLDLNLLVTLEALLTERNVTRAARRLNTERVNDFDTAGFGI